MNIKSTGKSLNNNMSRQILNPNTLAGTIRTQINHNFAELYNNTETVKSLSADWESTYTTFKNVSSTFLTSETDSQTLAFDEGSKELSISNGNMVSLSSLVNNTGIDTELRALSTNWESTFTAVQSNSATEWAAAITTTYDELTALKASNSLIPGQSYIISDYQTKWWRQVANNVGVMTSPVVEPLIVMATSTNIINNTAKSVLYPEDVITYDIDATQSDFKYFGGYNNGPIPNFKGWISRRHDTKKNISLPTDWRHLTIPCFRLNFSSISAWSSTTAYVRGDRVVYNSEVYAAIEPGTNRNPQVMTTNWARVFNFSSQTYLPSIKALQGAPGGRQAPNPGTYANDNYLFDSSTYIEQPVFTSSFTSQGSFDNSDVTDVYADERCYGNIFSNYIYGTKLGTGSILNTFGNMVGVSVGAWCEGNFLKDCNYVTCGSYCLGNQIGYAESVNMGSEVHYINIVEADSVTMGNDQNGNYYYRVISSNIANTVWNCRFTETAENINVEAPMDNKRFRSIGNTTISFTGSNGGTLDFSATSFAPSFAHKRLFLANTGTAFIEIFDGTNQVMTYTAVP